MSTWKIDRRFDTPQNAQVLAFLRADNPSAHSDVAEELLRSAEGMAGVEPYSPDRPRCAFVMLHLEDSTIIGLAYGQSGLAYRLPDSRIAEAGRAGAQPAEGLGSNWFLLEPWSDTETLQESRRRLAHWCRVAAGATHQEDSV
jgi:hypothetical protein